MTDDVLEREEYVEEATAACKPDSGRPDVVQAAEQRRHRLCAHDASLRARLSEAEEALQNIAAHVEECREGYIPASDLVMEVHYEIEDLRERGLLDELGADRE